MSEAILEVCGLTCERGERTLFRNLSFAVKPGTLVRIAGSNGAGKTTLLRLMTGLMRPVEGEVRWRGVPVETAALDFWRERCYIGHRIGGKDVLSVLENVMFNAYVAAVPVTENVALDALDAVGLADFVDVPAGQLSQGQRRRVALARLWLSRSVTLWVLDEPFTALAVRGVARHADLVSAQVRSGGIVKHVTHQEVPVDGVEYLVIEPERWSPRRRTAVEAALDNESALEADNAR